VKEAIHKFDWPRASAMANTILKRVVRERIEIEKRLEQDDYDVKLGRKEHQQEAKRSPSKASAFIKTIMGAIPRVLLGATISGTVTYLLFVLFSTVLSKNISVLPSAFGGDSRGI
jgi:hypothetical protein